MARRHSMRRLPRFRRSSPAAFGGPTLKRCGTSIPARARSCTTPPSPRLFGSQTAKRNRYGNSGFGNSCLVARESRERESGNALHRNHVGRMGQPPDYLHSKRRASMRRRVNWMPASPSLIADLAVLPGDNGRTRLDETLIVVKGEFGRTTGNLTELQGRDHYAVHSALFAGGGVRGGPGAGRNHRGWAVYRGSRLVRGTPRGRGRRRRDHLFRARNRLHHCSPGRSARARLRVCSFDKRVARLPDSGSVLASGNESLRSSNSGASRYHGPQIANVNPGGPWMFTKSVRPSGENVAPANSSSLSD